MAALAGVGCRQPPPVDPVAAAVLEGEWTVLLTVDPVPGPHRPDSIRGTMALLVNRGGVTVPDFAGTPLNVGVHDLKLGVLSPGFDGKELPEVVASVHADSVVLVLGPGASRPIQLRGTLVGDSVSGRWTSMQRAAVSLTGAFVLRRAR
ncbi:MAG: hypothetical protein AB7L66_08570 [Gemmatimonadales bacterium]